MKVILGIIIPPYAMALEFKTKEELQLMPQTMEEHLEELEDDDSDTEDLSFSSLDDDNVHEVQQRMKSSFCFCWFSFLLFKKNSLFHI